MINNLGRVKSLKFRKERILKQRKNNKGYFYVSLCKERKVKNKLIHVVLYEIFNNCKLKENECVHHDDENKENNSLNNLEKMTKMKHNKIHNTGKKHPMFGKHHQKNKEINE